MKKEQYYNYVLNNGLTFGEIFGNYLFDKYREFEFSQPLTSKLKGGFENNSDFNLSLPEMQEIIDKTEKLIENLLCHEDFDPSKEELRKKFPSQFSQKFYFRGKEYYLYPKGSEFLIDGEIFSAYNFIQLLTWFINNGEILSFKYESLSKT